MTTLRWIFVALVVIGVALATVSSLQPREPPAVPVHTVRVARATLVRTVSGAGKLEPARKVNVSSNITGVLLELKVGIGSKVKTGEVLGQIDTSRYASIVAQQRAALASARADASRARARQAQLGRDAARLDALADKDVVGAAEVEQGRGAVDVGAADVAGAAGRVQQAQAALDEASRALEWATLRAPVDGTVLAVNHRVGERLRGSDFAEDVVLVIGSVAQMEVRIEVGEHDVIHIAPGQRATVEIDGLPDQQLAGRVLDSGRDAIVKNAGTDNEVTTFPVWVTLDQPPPVALSGMSAHVDIVTDTRPDVIAVPLQAVTVRSPVEPKAPAASAPGAAPVAPAPAAAARKKLEKVVFVIEGGVARRRPVETGITSETMIQIVRGLEPGVEVVEGPYRTLARQLEDGARVAVEAPGGPPGGAPP